jgi:hypothetical protein
MERLLQLVVEVSEQLKYLKAIARLRKMDQLAACVGGIELTLRRLDFEKNNDEARRSLAYAMGALSTAYAGLGLEAPSLSEKDMFHVMPDGKAFPVVSSIL